MPLKETNPSLYLVNTQRHTHSKHYTDTESAKGIPASSSLKPYKRHVIQEQRHHMRYIPRLSIRRYHLYLLSKLEDTGSFTRDVRKQIPFSYTELVGCIAELRDLHFAQKKSSPLKNTKQYYTIGLKSFRWDPLLHFTAYHQFGQKE